MNYESDWCGCGFFKWIDGEFPIGARKAILDLLARVKKVEAENKLLQKKVREASEFSNSGGDCMCGCEIEIRLLSKDVEVLMEMLRKGTLHIRVVFSHVRKMALFCVALCIVFAILVKQEKFWFV